MTLRGLCLLLLSAFAAACSDGVTEPRELKLTLSPDTLRLTSIGDTAQFALTSNRDVPTGVWTSSDPSIATVDPNTGRIVSKAVGTAHILYSHETGSVSGVASVSQVPGQITVQGWPDTLNVRERQRIDVTIRDARGNPIPDAQFEFLPGGSGGVTIEGDSVLVGTAVGTADIQLRSGEASLRQSIAVVDRPTNVVIASGLNAYAVGNGNWAVQVVVRNEGFDGQFRILIYGPDPEPYRVGPAVPLAAGENYGHPPGTSGGGWYSPNPTKPTVFVVQSRNEENDPWRETARASIP